MNIYDLLDGYNLSAAERSFDELFLFESQVQEPFMCFNTLLKLTKNITANVAMNKHYHSVQFFDMWSNDVTQVIFDSSDGGKVSLFRMDRLLDDCLCEFATSSEIPDEVLDDHKITRGNIEVLQNLYHEIVEKMQKDETVIKNVL